MRRTCYFLVILLFAGCGQGVQQDQTADSTAAATDTIAAQPAAAPLPELVIAERAGGAITLTDTVNGKAILSLHDNTLLNSGAVTNGWAVAAIETSLGREAYESSILKKGGKLEQNGQEAGVALEDIPLDNKTEDDKGNRSGTIYAYVQEQHIKPGSVIETALRDHLQQHPDRSLAALQPFIDRFRLEEWDDLKPFRQYTNYESTAEDPSPVFRTVLIFYKDKLIGVADSRPLQLPATTVNRLERDFTVSFFEGVDKKQQEEYSRKFNRFINSVD